MSNDLITITGTATFNDNTENGGGIGAGVFTDTATNSGAVFTIAVFSDSAVNAGVAANATFSENSTNTGTVSAQAVFSGNSINTGSVVNAAFTGTSTNTGTVSGNAVFSDTSINNGVVQGNAQFEAGTTNTGAVSGSTLTLTDLNRDSSLLPHVVILNGAVTQSDEGNGVKAAELSISNYLTTEISAIGTNNYTVEMFFKSTGFQSDPDWNILFATGNDANDTSSTNIAFLENGTLIASTGTDTVTTTASFVYNDWNHVALVRNGTACTIYLNGVSAGAYTSNANLTQTIVTIGANDAGTRIRPFAGKIANFRVVIGTAIYTSNFAVPVTLLTAVTGTQLLLNFGATEVPFVGDWYADRSFYGGSTYTKSGDFNLLDEGGGVLVADHSNSGSLTVFNETAFDFGHDDFTIEYFTKISGWANSIDGADMSTGSHSPVPYMRFTYGPYSTGGAAFVWWDPEIDEPYNQADISGSSVVLLNQWYHMAATRSGNSFCMYINGVKIGEKEYNITMDNADISKMIFGGNDQYNQYTIGRMAAIRFVKGTALYSGSTFTVPTTVPTAVSGTSLLLTFGATAVPVSFAGAEWNGHTGCNNNIAQTVYTAEQTLTTGVYLFTDSGLTTAYTGYHFIDDSTRYNIAAADGAITSVEACDENME